MGKKKQTYASIGVTEGNNLILTTEIDIVENRIMEKINKYQ